VSKLDSFSPQHLATSLQGMYKLGYEPSEEFLQVSTV
jgi:hypothetical protein